MKKIILAFFVLFSISVFAQKQIDKLTYEDSQNSSVFQLIRNNTHVLKYTAADGSVLVLGDTLIIGIPSGSETTTTAVGTGGTFGVASAKSKTKNSFSNVIMGRPGGAGNLLNAVDGQTPNNAPAKMEGEIVVISDMRVIHKGSKKKPLRLLMLLGEPNGRAFGINKFMSVTDYEKAVIAGEIKSINAPMTRGEAIAKLKETKELFDLGLLEEDEFKKVKDELAPIIMNK